MLHASRKNAWTATLSTKAHKDANPRLMNTTEAAILAVSPGRVAQLLGDLDYPPSACGIPTPSARVVTRH